MQKRLKRTIKAIWFSLPIRLVLRQLQHHKYILMFWVLLIGLVSGVFLKNFGGAYLFLEPEYLGRESFWSLFFVGSAIGGFLFAYMITIYINESYRFHFLAFAESPFYTLAFNNGLIPIAFLGYYYYEFIAYHVSVQQGFDTIVLEKVLGLTTGILAVFLMSATYFFANRSFLYYYSRKLESGLAKKNARHNRKVIIDKAKESVRTPQKVSSYLIFPFHKVAVSSLRYGDLRQVVRTLNQHHGKLLLYQLLVFLLIAILGLLEGNPYFQIPAGASVMLIMSLGLMIAGAVIFWFRKSGILTVAVITCLIVVYNQFDTFHERTQAFGVNYTAPAVTYEDAYLDSLLATTPYEEDIDHTIEMLERWKARYQAKYGTHVKPKAVFVSASGGGLRSAFWTFRTLQHADQLAGGQLSDEMRLMTGASGGMYGLAYYRELYLRDQLSGQSQRHCEEYAERISQDLLNRIFFKSFTDIVLPKRSVQFGDELYDWETGFSFDQQVARNLPELAYRRLGDYSAYEHDGVIPQFILSPTIINQGKQLFVASSPVSYLARQNQISSQFATRERGYEFRRFFANHQPDSLWFVTALRMNATFPVVLPVVQLPSEPAMEIMDAGAIDNYGTQTSLKFLFEFRDWFAENTESVIFLQIRDNQSDDPIRDAYRRDALSRLLAPLGGGVYSMTQAKDRSNDYLLEFIHTWYTGRLEVVSVEYPKERTKDPASLSWHLTQREKQKLERSLNTPDNERAFRMLQEWYDPDLIARQP